MKKSLFLALVGIVIFSFSSCKQKNNVNDKEEGLVLYDTTSVTNIKIAPEYYFVGEFMYMADAASLKELVTDAIIPVAMEEDYPRAERQYMDMNPEMGERVYAEFRGYLKPKGADEEGPANQLVITQVITLDRNAESELGVLTGDYKSADETLTVNPDHTYELVYADGNTQSGNWFLSSKDILVLSTESGHIIMDIDQANTSFKTRGEKFTLYKRQ